MFNKKFYITIITIIILISSVSCNKVTPPDDGKLHKNHSLLIGEWLDSDTQYGENKYIYMMGKILFQHLMVQILIKLQLKK